MTQGAAGASAAKRQVTDHLGKPRDPEMKFFANPSPKIGRVLSAESSWRRDKKPSRGEDSCTYVGEAGLHLIEVKGRAQKPLRDRVLLFEEADTVHRLSGYKETARTSLDASVRLTRKCSICYTARGMEARATRVLSSPPGGGADAGWICEVRCHRGCVHAVRRPPPFISRIRGG